MTLNPLNWRRNPRRAARHAYFAIMQDPQVDTWRDTLRRHTDPNARIPALARLLQRELALYRLHDDAFGRTPWPTDTAGDAATGHAYGVMALALLLAAERARDLPGDVLRAHWTPIGWGRADLAATETKLADVCADLLAELATTSDPTEQAVLYTRLWIAAYPLIGAHAAEWIAAVGNDWECRAAGVQDGPETMLAIPDAHTEGVALIPATN